MRGKSRGEVSDERRVALLIQFLHLGFKDYIGARTLLRAGLSLQGAVLGSTAVEKYFKAIAAARGNRIVGHLGKKHINLVRNFVPDLFKKLSPEFLTFLERCYVLRYADELTPEFNLSIYARETLAELDHTIFHCEFQINLRREDGQRVLTMFRSATEKRDELLFLDNHLLLNIDKLTFLKQRDKAYSVRNRTVGGLLEAEFTVFESPTDGRFNREALRPVHGDVPT